MTIVTGHTGSLAWAAAFRPAMGDDRCGDLHVVCETDRGALVGVVDGLGHGAEAAEPAERAVATLRQAPTDSLINLVRRCHRTLDGTRGAVMTLARFDARDDTLTWISVGNVEGVLLRAGGQAGDSRESVLVRPGIVGDQLPSLKAAILSITPGDLLIMATDGVRAAFERTLDMRGRPEDIAGGTLERFARADDDALLFVGRYHGNTSHHVHPD